MKNSLFVLAVTLGGLLQAQHKLEQIRLHSSFPIGTTPKIDYRKSEMLPVLTASVLANNAKENLIEIIPALGLGYFAYATDFPAEGNRNQDVYFLKSASVLITPSLYFRTYLTKEKDFYAQASLGLEIPVYTFRYYQVYENYQYHARHSQGFFTKSNHVKSIISAGYIFKLRQKKFSVEAGYKHSFNRSSTYYQAVDFGLAYWLP